MPSFSFAQEQVIGLPGTLDEAGSFAIELLKLIPKMLEGVFEGIAFVFKQAFNLGGFLWDKYIWPQTEVWWQKALGLLNREIEIRKPIVEQELEKEKQEIVQEAQQQAENVGRGILDRLKEAIKNSL